MKDAIVCRFCGKDLPTVSSISLEIKSLVKERKLTPTVIQDNEIPIWKAGFSSMGWFEEIGQNTLATLNKSQDRFGTVQEPLLCVTYADTKGSHISEVQLNNKNLTSPFTALIATTKRFVFVEPNNKSVESIEHKNIHKIETNAQAGKKTYILTTTFGDTALLGVIFSSDEDASILESFFERVISVK